MFELIASLWPIILALLAFIGALAWGAKKKAAGRAQERDRARKAGDAAADEARRIRETAATRPMSERREEFTKWEK